MKLKFDINRDEIFESYLNGELSEDNKTQFWASINEDQRLKEEFEAYKLIHQFYRVKRQDRLKDVLKAHRENKKKKTRKLFLIRTMSTIAACLCGIIFLGNLIFGAKPTGQELYTSHFETYQNVYKPTVRSFENNNIPMDIDSQLMKAYDNEDYVSMTKIYSEHSSYTSSHNALSFYSAIAYMKLSKTKEAKSILQTISRESKFYDKSRWYLALCFLSEENISEFKNITKDLDYKKAKSKAILEELE